MLLLTINPGLQIIGTLPLGYVDALYRADLTAIGGLQPYTLTVTSALPSSLTGTDNGDGTLTISGVVPAEYNGTVDVQVTDARSRRVRKVLDLRFIEGFRITEEKETRLTEDGLIRLLG